MLKAWTKSDVECLTRCQGFYLFKFHIQGTFTFIKAPSVEHPELRKVRFVESLDKMHGGGFTCLTYCQGFYLSKFHIPGTFSFIKVPSIEHPELLTVPFVESLDNTRFYVLDLLPGNLCMFHRPGTFSFILPNLLLASTHNVRRKQYNRLLFEI